jgi:membrane protease YdiL (CAAX protease family)
MRHDTSDYISAFSVALGLASGGFLVSYLFQIPLLGVLSAFNISVESTIGTAGATLTQGIGFVLVVVGYIYYVGHPDLLNIRWPLASNLQKTLRDFGWVILGFIVLVVLSRATSLVLQQTGFSAGTNQIIRAVEQSPALALAMVILSFLAVGPGEETLFRGGVQGVLRRVLQPVPAIISSSALFGLAHVTAIVASSGASGIWGYVVSAFVLGFVLGSLYEYTDNLLIPIVVHGAYNAVIFIQYI